MKNLIGKTIKSARRLEHRWEKPTHIVIEFTDGSSITIVPSDEGDIYAGQNPYIELNIREGIIDNK